MTGIKVKDLPEAQKAVDVLAALKKRPAGRLKIYIGSAAGVGKTYRMLQEAYRLRDEGTDVVLGFIETHKRLETEALIGDLERIPLRKIQYKGREFEEMNLPAILIRHPQVVVIDELAHSNIPGVEHEKRYQDVEAIIAEGIDVISAINIQHIESLNPYIERLTGVQVHEMVPDRILQLADEIVNIDLSVEEHRERLRRGKIYPREKVATALSNFFTPENLSALREMALREVASGVERKTEERRLIREAGYLRRPEKVMVCLYPNDPNALSLLRRGARVAGRLNADWYAVTVAKPKDDPNQALSPGRSHYLKMLEAATELGAELVTIQSSDTLQGLLQFAEEKGITVAIFGKSQRPLWRQRLFGSMILEFMAHTQGIDVQVVDIVPHNDRH